MLDAWFASFIDWVSLHPHWSGTLVFLIALGESLAIVGLLVPGVAFLFIIGALVGAGALSFAPMCLWAIAGAVAGDSISFWLGRRFHWSIRQLWPFRSHPEILEKGVQFFNRYGGRSILFGRFVGPVRAIIPLVAGMMEMPSGRFLLANLVSALLWAPAYLFPGMVFGASLEIASKVTGRLVIFLIVVITTLWLAAWLTRSVYGFVQPRAYRLIHASFDWQRNHPLIAKISEPILDPRQRDYISLLIFALALSIAGQLIGRLLPQAGFSPQHLRTPWGDAFFSGIAGFAGYPAILLLFLAIGGWLALTRHTTTLIHWTIALLFCVLCINVLGLYPDRATTLDGALLRSGVMYGFLAVLLAGSLDPPKSRVVYSSVSLFCITILIGRIYLGGASLYSALLTVFIALLWLILLGVAYRRHRTAAPSSAGLCIAFIPALLIIGSTQLMSYRASEELHPSPIQTVSASYWWRQGWRTLPAYRDEVFNRSVQPLNIQWAANIQDIQAALARDGWHRPAGLTLKNALYWLNPKADLSELPLLPHFFQGRREALQLIKRDTTHRLLVLRLWASKTLLEDTQQPVWIGRVAYLKKNIRIGFFAFLDETDSDQAAFYAFRHDLSQGFDHYDDTLSLKQDGARPVLLIRLSHFESTRLPPPFGESAIPLGLSPRCYAVRFRNKPYAPPLPVRTRVQLNPDPIFLTDSVRLGM